MPIYIPPIVKKVAVGTIPTTLNDLADVIVSAPTSGHGLIYNGTYWVSGDIATQVELNNLATSTASASGSLQSQIYSNDSDISNLQLQINEITTGINIVFCEEFTGNGVSSTAQLDGSITNGQFISGGWSTIEVANTLPAYITDLNGKPIYNSSNIFTRTRISVSNINSSGLVTLSGIPLNSQQYKVWYFYSLSSDDRLDNYYRDDFVAGMEEEISSTVLGSQVFINTAAFNGILNGTHTTAQSAFDAIDDHLHPQYTLLTTAAAISGDLQDQIDLLNGATITSSGGSILVAQNGLNFNLEVASAPVSNHNDLLELQGGTSGQYYHLTATEYASISGSSGSYVPYTGATSNVDIGAYKLTADAFVVNNASVSSAPRQISWNETEKTFNMGLTDDVTLQVGQEDLIRVHNDTSSDILNGQPVYIIGYGIDDEPLVALAGAALSGSGSIVAGVATEIIPSGSHGFATVRGKIRDIDTSGYVAGQQIYIGETPGTFTADISGFALSSHINSIGYIGIVDAISGSLYVTITNEETSLSLSATERNILIGSATSTGVYDYTGMTIATSASFTVPPLKGFIVDNTGSYATEPYVTNVVFGGGTYPATNIATQDFTYVLIDRNNNIIQQANFPTPQERRDNILLGKVVHINHTNISIINNTVDYGVSPFSTMRDMFSPVSIINDGITPYPNGANLSFNKTAGSLYGLGINWTNNPKSPNKVTLSASLPVTLFRATQTTIATPVTTVDPTNYDVAGTITVIPNPSNNATNMRIYQFPTGTVVVQYGQTVYSSLSNAIAGIQAETFVKNPAIIGSAVLIGVLSVTKGCTDLSNSSTAKFTPVSVFGETTGGTAGISTTTLQQAYNNSTTPEIIINSTLDGVTIRNGTGNADNVTHLLEGENAVGTVTSFIMADGTFHSAYSIVDSISGASGNIVTHDASGKLLDSGILATDLTLLTTTASISGNLQSQINGKANTSHTHTSLDITDFNEAVYDNIATNGMLVAGSNVTFNYDDTNNQLTINTASTGGTSGMALLQGEVVCDTTNNVYRVSHLNVDINYSYPVVNLEVPTSGSNLFVQGLTNRTTGYFDVVLSETPNISGYKILWHLPTSNANVIGTAVVNQQITSLPSSTVSVSGGYNIGYTDTVVYIDAYSNVTLPSSPVANEHHWIVNIYGGVITIDGNGKLIGYYGDADVQLETGNSAHMHFNSTKDRWYIL
jgi:hypothetical protein